MKRFGKIMMAMVMAMVLVLTGHSAMAEKKGGMQLLEKALMENRGKDVKMGNTMVLDYKILIPVPMDWQMVPWDEMEDGLEFQCFGRDEKGRQVLLAGMIIEEGLETGVDVNTAQKSMAACRMSHMKVSNKGLDMLMTGDDEIAAVLLFTRDGKMLCLGFGGTQEGLDDVLESEKLLNDVAAILEGIWAADPGALTSFSDHQGSEETAKGSENRPTEVPAGKAETIWQTKIAIPQSANRLALSEDRIIGETSMNEGWKKVGMHGPEAYAGMNDMLYMPDEFR